MNKKSYVFFLITLILISCAPDEQKNTPNISVPSPQPITTNKPTVIANADDEEEDDSEEDDSEEDDTSTTTPKKTKPKKETPKVNLEEIFVKAELKNKLDFYVKDDIRKTIDGKGYLINYKNKNEEGIVIYKNETSEGYWLHGDIYKSFKQNGGLDFLGYPVNNQDFIYSDKLKNTVAKQLFEKGVIYYFNDPDLDSFYENTMVRLYDNFKVDDVSFKFKDSDLPVYSQKTTGRQGDPVNLIFIAKDQAQIEKAFESSKWVKPEFGFKNLPFSPLQIYGRTQDLGYAKDTSNIFTFFKKRHHIRFWKSDFKEGNNEVWIAGATEDVEIKFKDKELRKEEKEDKSPDKNNPLSHKIDPDTDKEREYVRTTLLEKNDKIKTYFIKHPKVKDKFVDTMNGGYDLVLWDGRILIMDLTGI